ncbi:MAG: Gfo/Idh/MocA family oxidoreductase [Ruminococcaceae bacterium]|nr:Gfo/Idh/MocA family oxidoreductase [Oscillospiraceae bacterium]
MREIKVAMLGFGGIAKSHKKAYEIFEAEGTPIKLVAICDINGEQFTKSQKTNLGTAKKVNFDGINLYTDLEEMMAKEEFEMIDICLPTYLHKEYTLKMLRAGKNVMCEKPMFLNSEDCKEMIDTANECGKKLMIGQCLRFEPQYLCLKELIDNKKYGEVKQVSMERLSALPTWGFENWFTVTEKSGGCALDLHVHDVDMLRFLFGEPEKVSAVAVDDVTRWQYINSRFYYKNFTAIATGSWTESATTPFKAGYRVRFEKASVVLEGSKVTVYPDEGEIYDIEYANKNRMAEEIRLIATSIADSSVVNTSNPPESAMKTVELVEKLCESADNGGIIIELN